MRFAERGVERTLHPATNKYIKYFDNIRLIQQYLLEGAATHEVCSEHCVCVCLVCV
jgi:2-phosphoglycerate kinase